MTTEAAVVEADVEEIIEAEVVTPSRPLPVRRESVAGLIRPVAKPSEVLEVQEATRELIAQTLKEDRDYGTIPGTKKPTLYKPGAERINAAFGCAAQYKIIEKEIDHDRLTAYVKRSWKWGQAKGEKIWSEEAGQALGLYRYVLLCQLVHRESGVTIGEGVGSCSTMEAKYIDRPRDLENTVLKMAKKRAYVDATLTTFGLSEQFTQDVEDMDLGDRGGNGSGHGNGNGNGHSHENGAAPDMIDCPACGGPMWDNRKTKKGRQPDLKCKSKDCDHAVWMDGWEKSLLEEIETVHMEGGIDAEQRTASEEYAKSGSPKKMAGVTKKMAEIKATVRSA